MRTALLACLLALPLGARAASTVIVVEGLGGNTGYAAQFAEQVDAIAAAARTLAPEPTLRLFRAGDASRTAVLDYFASLAESLDESDLVLVYLIGHGSYDDLEYKFNIPGPDLSDADLLAALDGLPSANQLIVNTSSASGAAAELWQRDSRVVITATKSGVERHATRFGTYFAAALSDPAADLDKNQVITAKEAFEFADRHVSDFFESDGRIATEHARLDGDKAALLTLARLTAARPAKDDARLDELVAARDEISAEVDALRLKRDDMTEDDYQRELLAIMLELAEAEDAIERREAELDNDE